MKKKDKYPTLEHQLRAEALDREIEEAREWIRKRGGYGKSKEKLR